MRERFRKEQWQSKESKREKIREGGVKLEI